MEYQIVRLKALHKYPWYADYFCRMTPIKVKDLAKKSLGPIAVDKYFHVYYDPDMFDSGKWTVDQLVAALFHETGHLQRRDHETAELKLTAMNIGRDQSIYVLVNITQDAAINDDMRDIFGRDFPIQVVFPESLQKMFNLPKRLNDGETWQHYFNECFKHAKKIIKDGFGGDGDGEGIPVPNHSDCGSCADGQKKEWEIDKEDPRWAGVTPIEAKIIERKTAENIQKAAASGRGDIPEYLQQWAQQVLAPPKISWQTKFRTACRQAIIVASGKSDFSYIKIPRRTVWADFRLPGSVTYHPNIVVVHDTSGSMWQRNEQGLVASEVAGILKSFEGENPLRVLSVDAALHEVKKIYNAKQVSPIGGGGTDMGLGIDEAMKLKPKPDVIVVMTDCETPWPDKAPAGVQVIICGIEASDNWLQKCPTWATVINAK